MATQIYYTPIRRLNVKWNIDWNKKEIREWQPWRLSAWNDIYSFLYNKSATILFLIESRLFTERGINYQTMAAIFTEYLMSTFIHGDFHMALPKAIADALSTEGIEHPRYLGEFSKEGLDSAFKNLHYPPKRMTYPDVRGVLPEDLVGIILDVQSFQISSKSQMRPHADWKSVKYYDMIHRDLTPANIKWSVLKIFEEKCYALVEKKYIDDPIVPKITKGI